MTQDISMKNTKKEMIEMIEKMQEKMSEKEKSTLNPQKVRTEAKAKEVLKKAEEVTGSDLTTHINGLKVSINQELSALAEKIDSEAKKYTIIQESINLKQAELAEIYEIEKQASSLAAIIESNHQAKEVFEADISLKRERLEKEIRDTRSSWEDEKNISKEIHTEKKKVNEKERKREEDEYAYNLQRSRAIEENNYTDKLAVLEKEIGEKKEQIDRLVEEKTNSLNTREQQIIEREKGIDKLDKTVSNFPKELESAINAAIEKKEKEITTFFEQEKALLSKGYEGEQRVLETKISALESLTKDQAKQIDKLNSQQEKAYQQVQDIAARAVTGASERPQSITVKAVETEAK